MPSLSANYCRSSAVLSSLLLLLSCRFLSACFYFPIRSLQVCFRPVSLKKVRGRYLGHSKSRRAGHLCFDNLTTLFEKLIHSAEVMVTGFKYCRALLGRP